jgi:hypothetical protein
MPYPFVLLAAPVGFALGGAAAVLAPQALRRRAVVERRVLAVVSAVVATFADGAATGISTVDVLYRAALGASVVHFGARARREVLLVATAIAVAGAWWSSIRPLPLLACGVSVGVLLTTRRSPLTNALIAFALVQTVLRLDLSHHGVSALVAGALTVPVAWSGLRRTRPRPRRTAQRVLAGLVGATAAAALLGVAAAWLAAAPLREAVDAATTGLDQARSGDTRGSRTAFRHAEEAFDDASGSLAVWWSLPARLVPIVGQHLAFAREVAIGGRSLAATGEDATAAANAERLQVVDGGIDLAAVNALAEPLRTAAARTRDAEARLEVADSSWLLPPLRRRLGHELDRVTKAQRDAERAAKIVDRLPSLLGGTTPRRYFLLIQTPAESRALGGFIGSYGEITAVNGHLELARFGRTRELQTTGTTSERQLAAPPDYVARYSRFDPAVTWQNVTMSPDGPTVAQVVASLYPQSGGSPIDGVVAIDPGGLAALLRVTGPLTVAPWPEPLTADNAEQILLVDQYVRLGDPAREEFLGDVAEQVVRRLTNGTLPRPAALVEALARAVAEGHLSVVSLETKDAALLRSLDLDLAVDPVNGDYLGVVTQNASSNKIDSFLRRSYSYDVELGDDGTLRSRLEVTLRNTAPAAGLPEYVIGNQLAPPLPDGSSRLYVSVYSPWGLRGATLGGEPSPMESETELGRRVYSRYVDLGPGESKTLRLELSGSLDGKRPYVLDLRHQPGTVDRVDLSLDGQRQQVELRTDRRLRGS